MPARSVCLMTLSLSEAGPGSFGRQVSVTDIYHAIQYLRAGCPPFSKAACSASKRDQRDHTSVISCIIYSLCLLKKGVTGEFDDDCGTEVDKSGQCRQRLCANEHTHTRTKSNTV